MRPCPLFLAESALPPIVLERSSLWMLAGFVLLGWVMARMTIRRKKNAVRQGRDDRETQRRLARTRPTSLPLSDAPEETQRWQVAMFDLQRELKGELDSRIAITQSLIRQLDQRIQTLQQLQSGRSDSERNEKTASL
jgi:hypothetical protein